MSTLYICISHVNWKLEHIHFARLTERKKPSLFKLKRNTKENYLKKNKFAKKIFVCFEKEMLKSYKIWEFDNKWENWEKFWVGSARSFISEWHYWEIKKRAAGRNDCGTGREASAPAWLYLFAAEVDWNIFYRLSLAPRLCAPVFWHSLEKSRGASRKRKLGAFFTTENGDAKTYFFALPSENSIPFLFFNSKKILKTN